MFNYAIYTRTNQKRTVTYKDIFKGYTTLLNYILKISL